MKWERAWLSPEAKKAAKKKALEEDMLLGDYLDYLILGKKKNKGGGGFDPFF